MGNCITRNQHEKFLKTKMKSQLAAKKSPAAAELTIGKGEQSKSEWLFWIIFVF